MDARKKNIIYTLVLVSLVAIVYFVRQTDQVPMVSFNGKTMGPIIYYIREDGSILGYDPEERNFKAEIDSLLNAFNASLNTYIPGS